MSGKLNRILGAEVRDKTFGACRRERVEGA